MWGGLASQIWQRRLYFRPRGRDFVVVSFFEGKTDGFETNKPQRAPKGRRRIGRWARGARPNASVGPGTGTRPWIGPGSSTGQSDDHGHQGVDRIRPALPLRDLGAHRAPDRR